MKTLVRRYLVHRRAMGYALVAQQGHLRNFARFAARVAAGEPLTTALAVKWATSVKGVRPYQAKCLSTIRNYARFCVASDPRTQVPANGLLGPSSDRIRPHIYSRSQLRTLMVRAGDLSTRQSLLRPYTYQTLIGLLACTGIRPGEARRLRIADFDPGEGTLRVPPVKSSPERLLPLHSTTVLALLRYLKRRRKLCPFGEHLFVGPRGQRIASRTVEKVFREIARDMPSNGARNQPRLHDCRHTFATRHIAAWSRQSAPLAHRLLLLSRYLGHRTFHDTWWYVTSDATALRESAKQFDRFRHGRSNLD